MLLVRGERANAEMASQNPRAHCAADVAVAAKLSWMADHAQPPAVAFSRSPTAARKRTTFG
jgi:hypothetical protein